MEVANIVKATCASIIQPAQLTLEEECNTFSQTLRLGMEELHLWNTYYLVDNGNLCFLKCFTCNQCWKERSRTLQD